MARSSLSARRLKHPPVERSDADPLNRMYDDPRQKNERRKKSQPENIPVGGDRRINKRRATVYLHNDNWWMKRNYNNNEK